MNEGGRPPRADADSAAAAAQFAADGLGDPSGHAAAILETSHDWIWAVDGDLVLVSSNPAIAEILGYSPDELLGCDLLSLVHPSDRDARAAEISHCRVDQRVWRSLLCRWRHADGTWRYLESNAAPVLDAAGDLIGFRGIDRDVTDRVHDEEERRRLGAQLLHDQKITAVGALAAGIAHDMNNILSGIFGYLELALLDAPSNSEQADSLHGCMHAAQRARDLVQRILQTSRRAEPGEHRAVDVSVILTEVQGLLRGSLPATYQLRVDVEPDCPPVVGDAVQLHQLAMNLCTNAYFALRDKEAVPGEKASAKTLGVGLRPLQVNARSAQELGDLPSGEYLLLTISDTGIGMDAEMRRRVFERYFTTRERNEGTGLGLSTVQEIVAAHRGAIRVYSEPGQGSTFKVYLPVVHDVATPSAHEQPLLGDPSGSERLLLVDDEADILGTARPILEGYGYDVTTAASGDEALDRFGRDPGAFDLVVTDLTMPNVSGLDLTRELLGKRPDLPVILCTGFSDTIGDDDLRGAGVRRLLHKPLLGLELALAIREVIDEAAGGDDAGG